MHKPNKLIAALLTCLALFLGSTASARTLEPADEAARDPQLAALIETLVRAADAKDFAPFELAISPNAIASFDGTPGPQGFRDAYAIADPNSPFWADFKAALALGGAFMGDAEFAAPYVYANMPEDLDSYAHVVAIGAKTSLFAGPEDDARIIADVTHQILELVDGDPEAASAAPEGWIRVKAKGRQGFVKAAETRSPLDYRIVFQKTANRWWIGAFVAGD
jgi:hypothetical protein